MKYQTLNSDEKTRLVTIILDSVDELMSFDDFQEIIGLFCEDIPGLEFISDGSLSALIMECWEIFQQTPFPISVNW